MDSLLHDHPWIALLGWLPPVYLVGLIRTWGKPEYQVTLLDLFDVGVTAGLASLWWPSRLHSRLRRGRRDRGLA